ncbi:MAG TPA: DHH family phosphoesterase [Candidatus Syntrophosphaera sp.]|nr:DHH family phosphoesterase [Candidatus Syntrophosphaera sp.]
MVEPSAQPGRSPLLEQITDKRGLQGADLAADIYTLPDEGLLANIDKVAERIGNALYRNEPLAIFGHDDPDGVTSTYILYQFLNSCGYQKHNYFIPNRNLEPHGIQQSFVDFVAKNGYKLAITVDNGISSQSGVAKLKALGCETIVVDHHLIQPEQLPDALAIVNPQLPECQYPFKQLAGVGVTLMLVRYLGRILEHPVPLSAYFWTAVGSIADKVPMTGLNRILARHVIEHWDELDDPSIEFLARNHTRIDGAMDIFNFMQATARLIANGREEGGQHTALRFLLQRSDAKARLFQNLEEQKNQWEGELNRVFSFLDTVSAGFEGNGFIYFDDDDVIPYALLGTASTYILGKLGIPTLMLKLHNGDIVCEGRCGEGFNMVEAFRACKGLLKQFGGHVRAAGFVLEQANYDAFLECYNDFLAKNPVLAPSATDEGYDAVLALDEFDDANWRDLEYLLPFGQQNPEPRILVPQASLDALQGVFILEHGSLGIPPGKTGAATVHWKGRNSARVLAFRATPPV